MHNSIILMISCNISGPVFQLSHTISHGKAEMSPIEKLQIIISITKSHGLLFSYRQNLLKLLYSCALVHPFTCHIQPVIIRGYKIGFVLKFLDILKDIITLSSGIMY